MSIYLKFEGQGTSTSGKTKRFAVRSVESDIPLGWISWHAHWRRYCFYTRPEATIFDANCLHELGEFLRKLMLEHKDA